MGGVSAFWQVCRSVKILYNALNKCYYLLTMKASLPRPSISLGVLSARLDGRAWNAEAAGSNPATQTTLSSSLLQLSY